MRWNIIALNALAATFFLQTLGASLWKTPAFDEPFHIAAGLSYIYWGRIAANEQHPPLLKELSGLFMRAAGVRWPDDAEASTLGNDALVGARVGSSILARNGPEKVLFWARLPFILLGTAMVFLLYALGRRLVGEAAALGAVLLYAFDPNVLGHSFLVYTDTGLAFFVVLVGLALWSYLCRPGWVRMIVCGLALGGALVSKFSGVVMLPVVAVLFMAAAWWPVEQSGGDTKKSFWPRLTGYGIAFLAMCVIALGLIQYVYLLPKNPLAYVKGMQLVNADHIAGYLSYLAGAYAKHFNSYYAVAYLLKEPVASIALACIGLWALFRNSAIPRLARAFILVPAVALFMGYTLFSDDLGFRYVIPVLPFTFLLGGLGLASLLQSGKTWTKAVAGVLSLWLVIAAAGIYPDGMSYFNEAACVLAEPSRVGWDGGSRCGPSWLDDSNIDVGQGLKQLRVWLDRHPTGAPPLVAYFGSVPPELYGVHPGPSDYADILERRRPGLYVVSAQIVARAHRGPGSNGAAWLAEAHPFAVVGHSLYIYDLR